MENRIQTSVINPRGKRNRSAIRAEQKHCWHGPFANPSTYQKLDKVDPSSYISQHLRNTLFWLGQTCLFHSENFHKTVLKKYKKYFRDFWCTTDLLQNAVVCVRAVLLESRQNWSLCRSLLISPPILFQCLEFQNSHFASEPYFFDRKITQQILLQYAVLY